MNINKSTNNTGKKLHRIKIKKLWDARKEYNKHPKICPVCGNIISFYKKHCKFCSQSCAITFTNTGKKLSNQTKCKIAKSIHLLKLKKIKICKYCGQPLTYNYNHDICKKHRIFKSLEKFGFNNSCIGTINLFNEYNRVKNIIIQFYNTYLSDEKMLNNMFNYTSGASNFHKLFKSLDIKTNTPSIAIQKSILSGKYYKIPYNTKYKTENHISWNNKRYFLRSSFETDYANYLDKLKIDYEVEFKQIKYFDTQHQKYRIAIPDFFIPTSNLIVEIKSTYTLDIQNMKDKFVAYKNEGYNVKLILDHQETNLYTL